MRGMVDMLLFVALMSFPRARLSQPEIPSTKGDQPMRSGNRAVSAPVLVSQQPGRLVLPESRGIRRFGGLEWS